MSVDGFAVVDKPAGMTSHDVVARARKSLSERRIGHAGTLDPDATGVLLLGIGKGTRLLQFLTGAPKSYVGEIALGSETSTLDASGETLATFDMSGVTPDQVADAARRFVGKIEQIPPMVSAIKVGGRRLYELARDGIEVERKARRVTITRFDVAPVVGDEGVYRAHVDCSSGTYIRTLAADLGRALGGGAHLRSLRRTAVGPFTADQACPLDALVVRPVLDMVAGLAQARVDAATAVLVSHGRVLRECDLAIEATGPFAVLGPGGELLAVYAPFRAKEVKPQVVLVPSSSA